MTDHQAGQLSDADGLRAAWDAQRDAMIFGDVTLLDSLLDDDFTLTHMTGYKQPKAEWLSDIDTDRMSYHAIEDVEVSTHPTRNSAVLTAQTVTEATIWGGHGTWRLQLRYEFERRAGDWIAMRCIATTW